VQLGINGSPSVSCELAAEQESPLIRVMGPKRAGASVSMPDLPGPQ
jgi:hypothetical protein